MSPPLPVCSAKETGKALERSGFRFIRQKGSLRAIVRQAGLTLDEFIRLLK